MDPLRRGRDRDKSPKPHEQPSARKTDAIPTTTAAHERVPALEPERSTHAAKRTLPQDAATLARSPGDRAKELPASVAKTRAATLLLSAARTDVRRARGSLLA